MFGVKLYGRVYSSRGLSFCPVDYPITRIFEKMVLGVTVGLSVGCVDPGGTA